MKPFPHLRAAALLLLLLTPLPALGQGTLLQGGPFTPGHVPQYVGQGSSQAVVQDGGGAGGGAVGVNPSELGITARGTGTPPYAGQGTGPYGSNFCDYDAPITNAAGYHFLCFSPNAQGGGLIAYGAGGIASPLPLSIILNGVTYPFPFAVGGIVGPGTTIVGDLVLWNNTTGTLVKDAGYGISGIDANVLNAQTANYTIAATDCGKTVQAGTGSTGQFTLTLPSVSGFAATCSVAIKNGDTSRGKILSGFPADFGGSQNVLWPLQSGTVKIVNGAWSTGVAPGIWNQATSQQLNVDHTLGSDSNNDCLGAVGTSGACATLIHAFQLFQTTVKVPLTGTPTIQTDCGFREDVPGNFLGPAASGPGGVVAIIGNNASPASCTWTSAGWGVDDGAAISLQGIRTANAASNQTWVTVGKLGLLAVLNIVFGPATTTGSAHVQLTGAGANFVWDGGIYQVGDAICAPNCMKYHIINSGGAVALQHASISVPNALSFNTFYVGAGSGSQGNITTAFTGAGSGSGSTGVQYNIGNNATLGLQPTTGIPGATAGSSNSGGAVDSVSAAITSDQLPNPANFSGQLYSSFGTPTIASGACGAAANGSVSGTNQSGVVTIGAAATTTCTVSFSTTLSVAPKACVIAPGSGGAAAQGTTLAWVGAPSTTAWVITGSALASTTYRYVCL